MNLAGYSLAFLLFIKWAIVRFTGYAPTRWAPSGLRNGPPDDETRRFTARKLAAALAVLTATVLGYCLISAANARATFHDETLTFEYHECFRWLPHSFDSTATWSAFWAYLGLACWFWGLWDWLGGKLASEAHDRALLGSPNRAHMVLPKRLQYLLWILAISGAALAVEGLVQRLANSPRLLFLVLPQIHQTAATQFGPYAYRSNAAQYFNLLWPVCLGWWWESHGRRGPSTVGRTAEGRRRPCQAWVVRRHWLLVCGALMAACPLISGSRGGALIMLGMTVGIGVIAVATGFQRGPRVFAFKPGREPQRAGVSAADRSGHGPALALCLGSAVGLGLALGWGGLKPRLADMTMAGRNELCEAARPMARDFPLFGTGPGTFETVSQLYPRPAVFWPAQLHNDWLETRITFGWVGTALIALALGTVLARWFVPDGVCRARTLAIMLWLAMGGCLAHAWVDFPFQVHSVLLLFLTWCAALFRTSR